MEIRLAKTQDAKAILNIYKPYVLDTPITFEYEVPTLEEIEKRIADTSKKFPWLLYEKGGNVVAYAYASTHRKRSAYDWTCECSVYVHIDHQQKGIGTALYTKLFNSLGEQGIANVLAGIALPNEASVKVHEKMGFESIGIYKNIGFKFGKWWDVGWWQLQLKKN